MLRNSVLLRFLKREARTRAITVRTISRERKSSGVRITLRAVRHESTATSRSHGLANLCLCSGSSRTSSSMSNSW